MYLLYSSLIIVGTFSISTITAFLICYYNNYPFSNPDRMNDYLTPLDI
jgi:hypothetical protein